MSAAAALNLRSDWHRLGAGLRVQFSMCNGRFECEWQPRRPTKREWQRLDGPYRAARDIFLRELAQRIGGQVVCVEVGE